MTLADSVFEQKNICVASPGDRNSDTSKEGSFSDLTSWFYLGSIDRCASSLAHEKWSTVLQGEKSMICSASAPPPNEEFISFCVNAVLVQCAYFLSCDGHLTKLSQNPVNEKIDF